MDTFTALAEPSRRTLLNAMLHAPSTVTMLVEVSGLSQPAVSKHLKYLREAELVIVRPEGQKRWYHVNPEPLRDLELFLEPYRAFLNDRLDALERHLDQHPEKDYEP